MRASFRALFAVLFSIGLLFGAGTGPAQADEVTPQNASGLRFLSYNVCGAKCRLPAATDEVRSAWVAGLVKEIDAWDSDLIMLQELCHGQWELIRDALAQRSGEDSYATVWGAALPAASGCDQWGSADRRFGLAIFSKGANSVVAGTRTVEFLPEPEEPGHMTEDRILLCARTALDSRVVRACNTHIEPRKATKAVQIPQVAKSVEALVNPDGSVAEREPVVLAGDFNQGPEHADMNGLYNHGADAAGRFQEVDENDKDAFEAAGCLLTADRCRSGEPTATPTCAETTKEINKIDYVFLSYEWFKTVRGDALPCPPGMSDHHPLRGAAAWEK